ncbi:MAG: ammonium transporter, partial [Deltaproteobacteria bacterium]|nr:ammonium transporter [Deltaproteobacteria bacterium]
MILFTGWSFAAEEAKAPEPAKAEAPAAAPAPAAAAPPQAAAKEDPGKAPVPFTQALLDQVGGAKVAMDTVWTLMTAFLVFFMNLGFATLEAGFCRAKNVVTVLAKNFVVFAVSSIAFLVLGFGIMFGDGTPFFGTQGIWFVGG